MTFSPFLCLNEEIMQCFFVNGAKIVFNSFRYNKSLKPKKERNGNETEKSCLHSPLPGKGFVIIIEPVINEEIKECRMNFYIVADAIKALRESRGLTQEQLAEKADISVSHLAKIETHARLMGMKTYIRLLEAMDIPIKEHFIHMGTAKKDMMLKEKIWYLVQDCDERETNLLIYSIEGIKKGLKKYQQDSRK